MFSSPSSTESSSLSLVNDSTDEAESVPKAFRMKYESDQEDESQMSDEEQEIVHKNKQILYVNCQFFLTVELNASLKSNVSF